MKWVTPWRCRYLLAVVLGLVWPGPIKATLADPYDPLQVANIASVQIIDLTMADQVRNREIPLRSYLPPEPDSRKPAPVILFSHGLGGSRTGYSYLGRHWAARGYVAVFLQHPGSDDSVWKDVPLRERMAAMQKAASAENLILRVQDVHAVLDQLEKWNKEVSHQLYQRLDLNSVGMSGHSFGGLTTQVVAGEVFPLIGQRARDPRIKAALILSPSSPRYGSPQEAFAKVNLPWMLMTGTRDVAPIGGQTVESRRAVFSALPSGEKYELVLFDAEHSAFTDRSLPGETRPRNPNHHRAILALSTAFWDAYLRGNSAARQWLDGEGPKSILDSNDVWQRK
ncbi:MAG: alpha/beta hydrolase family protein [Thermogutta sp.]